MTHTHKNIWIINEYAGGPHYGMEYRHYYLSKALQEIGYNVVIISASYSHLFYNLPSVQNKFTLQEIDGVKYLWIKVPQYTQSHSKKRVWKWLVYTYSLFDLPIHQLPTPNYIIVSPMQTMPIYPAYRWAKKFNSNLIFEVKDIWPLSIIELGGYSPSHPFIKLLKYFEKWAIQKSDAIFSVLPNYGQYLKDQGYDVNFHYIPNGIDINDIQQPEPLHPDIARQIPDDKFIIGYAGTMGKANALHYFIKAAQLLQNYPNILFLLVGNGDKKHHLIQQSKGLSNVLFLPPISKKQMQSMLSKWDVCYIGLENKGLFQYGVSPNKVFDYMYSAKPILFSVYSPNNVVELAQCGICVNPADPVAIADAILKFYQMPLSQRIAMGNKGKEYVLSHHTFQALAKQYDDVLKNL